MDTLQPTRKEKPDTMPRLNHSDINRLRKSENSVRLRFDESDGTIIVKPFRSRQEALKYVSDNNIKRYNITDYAVFS